MTNIKEIQEFNRKKIIMACNPECDTYEEALKEELGFGCKILVWSLAGEMDLTIYDYDGGTFSFLPSGTKYYQWKDRLGELRKGKIAPLFLLEMAKKLEIMDVTAIIGKPLTLDRVLPVLLKIDKLHVAFWSGEKIIFSHPDYESFRFYILNFDLERESKKTQTVIAKLLGKEDE